MIPQRALRISYIILTITLTAILISSPVIAEFSPSFLSPTVLKIGIASASSSENGGDGESNTDDAAAATGDEENGGDDDGDGEQQEGDNTQQQQAVQEEGDTEEVQDAGAGEEEQQEQQLATVIGEVCDDFEDNDGDGLIDLADMEDCAAAPLTQGTVTAPTTPSPSPSVINTTATNSTNNTLTASEITTREITTPSTDHEASGITEGNTVTDADGRPVYDLEKDCESYEELGIPPPPLGFGQPPDAKWYHCPPGVGVWVTPNGTSSLGTTEGGGQQPNSASACPPQPTNYYDAQARIIHVQLPPSSSASPSSPQTTTTTNPCPPGQSSPTQTADTLAPSIVAPSFTVEAGSEQSTQVSFTVAAHDTVDGAATLEEDGVTVTQDNVASNIVISCAPNSGGMFPVGVTNVQCSAVDQSGNVREHSFTITVTSSSSAATPPPQTLQAPPPSTTTTSQGQQQPPPNSAAQAAQGGDAAADAGASGGGAVQGQQQPNSATTTPQAPTTTTTPQGGEQGQQVPGTTSPGSTSTTTSFPGGISITKDSNGIVEASIPDSRAIILSSPNGGVEAIEHPDGVLLRTGEGSVSLRLPNANDAVLKLSPDGIGQIFLGDTTITGNRDGTITIEKPYGTSTYSLDGKVVTTNPADGTSTSSMIGSVNGGITKFPGGISIAKGSNGRVVADIPDSETRISYGPNGGLEFISHPNGLLSRSSGDGSVSALLEEDEELKLRPDGIGEIDLDEDGIFDITGNRDGTLTISKPITDPATGVETEGASMTTTYKAP